MEFRPKLNEYNINALAVLANNSSDEFTINKIKMIIIEKILNHNYSMFYLIHKFNFSKGILKESYADVVLMNMKGNDYYIDDMIVDEILKYASCDAIICYGAYSNSYEFNVKCKDEFNRRIDEFEDKIELQRKSCLGKSLKKEICIKRKVIRNDKY